MASVSAHIDELRKLHLGQLSVLTNGNDQMFKDCMQRWSEIDLKIPSAIVLPTTEEEIQKTVQWAVKSSVPFVVKAGGHSEWSTIDKTGIIIDLSHYASVEFHQASNTATLRGSVLSKDVAVKLSQHGRCTALGNGNSVGAIGYFLGGGASVTTSATGYGAEQIVGARMVTAKGVLINVDKETNPELLWAIRGAGHFFGVITQLVIQTLPLSVLGNDKGVIWAGIFGFPLPRAREVCSAMQNIMNDAEYATSGLMMIMAPPPARNPSLIISARLIGNPADAQKAYQALYELNPLIANGGEVPLPNASDARAALGAKGDFKRFSVVGLHDFDINAFMKTIDVWQELITECPDSINTAFNFQWDSRSAAPTSFETAMSLRDVRFWQNNLIWHTNSKNRERVDQYADKCIDTVRASAKEVEHIDFVNGTRTAPIMHRYRGADRLKRLQALKQEWDPQGIFTRQLL